MSPLVVTYLCAAAAGLLSALVLVGLGLVAVLTVALVKLNRAHEAVKRLVPAPRPTQTTPKTAP